MSRGPSPVPRFDYLGWVVPPRFRVIPGVEGSNRLLLRPWLGRSRPRTDHGPRGWLGVHGEGAPRMGCVHRSRVGTSKGCGPGEAGPRLLCVQTNRLPPPPPRPRGGLRICLHARPVRRESSAPPSAHAGSWAGLPNAVESYSCPTRWGAAGRPEEYDEKTKKLERLGRPARPLAPVRSGRQATHGAAVSRRRKVGPRPDAGTPSSADETTTPPPRDLGLLTQRPLQTVSFAGSREPPGLLPRHLHPPVPGRPRLPCATWHLIRVPPKKPAHATR